ncbi:Ig-like domain-containing protein [Alteromonas sp. R78001]
MNKLNLVVLCIATVASSLPSYAVELNEKCVVNILNRTIQVDQDGYWALPNVPSNMGRIRARATCQLDDGRTVSGQSDYFAVVQNSVVQVGDIQFENVAPIPSDLNFSASTPISLDTIDQTFQLTITASYSDDSVQDVTSEISGINYGSTNPAIASVTANGLVTAHANGIALISARKDGVLVSRAVNISTSGDADGDGLPDDYETENGLNPADPVDAFEDKDGDGLTALEEYSAGTDINNADSDNDGISDKEELEAGEDGFITNPLLADSDGDGIRDGLEIFIGSDPNDENSGDLSNAVNFITVSPAAIFLTYNAIDGEASGQLRVTGHMLDGSEIDLTEQGSGTTYTSADLTIASFGLEDGEVFAGQEGTTEIIVSNNGSEFTVAVEVDEFEPVAVSAISIPGYANNVDVQGDIAYVAAGGSGLQIVNVADRTNPSIISAIDTSGTAIDVKVRGEYVYIADGSGGLIVVNVSDELAPTVVQEISTSGFAKDLSLHDDYIYIASDIGLEIFSIADPNNVIPVGENDALSKAKGVATDGDLLALINDNALAVFDITDRTAPLRITSSNIGNLKSIDFDNGYIYVAAYSTGWRSYKLNQPSASEPDAEVSLQQVAGNRDFVPRDVAVADGFTFFAEQLFPNVVAFVNTRDAENPFFQSTINLSSLGDYAGTGIAVDSAYAYITEERYIVSSDYKATGTTKLFIAQYRMLNDANGIAPEVNLLGPTDRSVVVAGSRINLSATANDDVAVRAVEFWVNGNKVAEDSTYPYQVPYTVVSDERVLTIVAKVFDYGSNSAESSPHLVEVQPDGDNDGLGDNEEVDVWHTDPNDADSDNDGVLDGEEIARGIDPNNVDSDSDGLNDGEELLNGTDPRNPDTEAPFVTATSPENGVTDQAENTPVEVVFNEPLLAKSVKSGALSILEDGLLEVPGSLRLTNGGTTLSFTASDLLKDYTNYTVVVAGVKDIAGNPIVEDYQFSFETGNTVDTDRPTVISVTPTANSTGVPVNASITVVLSERIDPLTIDENALYVVDRTTGLRIDGVTTLLDDNQSLTFAPNVAFLVGRQHQIVLTSQIKDLFGNTLYNTNYYFTTSFDTDATGPQIIATSVLDEQSDVPINARIRVRFDEAVNSLTLDNTKLLLNGNEVAVDTAISDNNTVVSLTPRLMLEPNTSYELFVDLVTDLSGNFLQQSKTIGFTTTSETDTASESITGTSPKSNDRETPLNAILDFSISGRLDPTTVTGNEVYLLDYDGTRARVSAEVSLSNDGQRISLIPSEPLLPGTRYRIYLGYGNYIYDLAGNRLSSNSYYFYTGTSMDTDAPEVVNHGLSGNVDEVALNSVINISFNEPLSEVCLSGDTVQLSNSSGAVAVSWSLSSDKQTLKVYAEDDLVANSDYQLTLNGLCDLAGQTLDNYQLNFTTGTARDTSGPSVIAITPSHGSTDVGVDSSIRVEFSEVLDPVSFVNRVASGHARVYAATGNVAGEWDVNGSVVVFTPTNPLPGATRVTTYLNDIEDQAGNDSSYRTYYFNTAATLDGVSPVVTSVVPADGAMDVGPNNDVVLTFSESLNSADINSYNFVVYNQGSLIRPTVYHSRDGRTVTLRSTWPSNAVLTVVVTGNVRDLSGNYLTDYASVFTTAVVDTDRSRPSVSRVYPSSGATNVPVDSSITLYTNEVMNESSLEEAIHVAQNGVLIGGTLTVTGSGRAIVFTPQEALTEGALIQVYLDSTATDDSGNALNSYESSFRVATPTATAGVRPVPIGYSPYSNQDDAPLNPTIQIAFNQAIDEGSLSGRVLLTKQSGGGEIAATVTVEQGSIVQIVPDTLLDAETDYYVRLDYRIEDMDGDQSGSWRYLYFSTGSDAVADDQQPQVVAMSPPDGTTDVALNPRIHVRFDEAINPIGVVPEAGMDMSFASNQRELLYTRHRPWLPASEITESVPSFTDIAGNAGVGASTSFTTGQEPDVAAPTVETYLPEYNATVPTNAVVRIRLNEAVDPLQVNTSNVYVVNTNDTSTRIPGQVSVESDGRTIVWTPNEVLAVNDRFYVRAYYMTDLSGNSTNHSHYFYTSSEADYVKPTVLSTSVTEGQTEVPLNARLRVRFSESMLAVSQNLVQLSSSVGNLPVSYSWNSDRTLLTLTPKQLLDSQTIYTLDIGAIVDISGNSVLEQQISFTSGISIDTRAESTTSYSLASNARDVPLNPSIEFTLNGPVDPATVSGNEVYLLDYDGTRARVSAEVSLSNDGQRISLIPSEPLLPGTRYRIYLGYGNYIYDLAGNRLSSNSYYFYTGTSMDTDAPEVVNHGLSGNVDEVALNSVINISFNEPLSEVCLSGDTVQLSNSSGAVAVSWSLSSDKQTLKVYTEDDLVANSDYQLTLNGLCDLAGQTLDNYQLNFTTGTARDTSGPSVIAITPSHGSTDVGVDSSIRVEFSEVLDPVSFVNRVASGHARVYAATGNVAGEWDVNGSVVVFTPTNPLPGATRVTTYLNDIEDQAGNDSSYRTYYFNTAATLDGVSPVVTSVVPADGAMDVGPNNDVVLTFSESLNSADINSYNFVVYNQGSLIRPTVYHSRDGRTVTLRSTWPSNAVLTVVVTGNVRDLSGNYLTDYASVFTTAVVDTDRSRPSVSRVYPSSGATNVPVDSSITLYTNEVMNESSLEEAIHVAQNGVLIGGTLTVTGSGRAIVFTPQEALTEGALIQVYLDSTATDDSGNALNSYESSFRVATPTATAGVRPVPIGYSPYSNQDDAPLNPTIQIAFNQAIDEGSLSGRVLLTKQSGGGEIAATVTVEQGSIVQIVPDTLLDAETDYYVRLDYRIEDMDGDQSGSWRYLYFSTGSDAVADDQQPQVVAMSPPDGTTDVALNPRIHVRFDEAINPIGVVPEAGMDMSFASNQRELLYTRHRPWLPASEITESVPSFTDIAGNAGVGASTSFTTGQEPDVAAPTVETYLPEYNATVPTNAVVRIRLNEAVDPLQVNTSNVYVVNTNDTSTRIPGQVSVESDGRTIVWTPNEVLAVNDRFYVRAYYMTDLSGNSTNHSHYFYTSSEADYVKPTVLSTSVTEGQTEVPLNARLRVRFSEPMSSLESELVFLTSLGESVPVNYSWNSDRTLLTLIPKQLMGINTTYTLNIGQSPDLSGNTVTPVTVSFTTGGFVDSIAGNIVTYSPSSNATDVPLNAVIEFKVSDELDPTLLTSGSFYVIDVDGDGLPILASLLLSEDGQTARLTPSDNFEANNRYRVYFGYGENLYDLAGNRLPYTSFYFYSGDAEDDVAIEVKNHNLSGSQNEVATNIQLRVTLSEKANPLCVTSSNVLLSDLDGLVPINVGLSSDQLTLLVTPTTNLKAVSNYALQLKNVCDLSLNKMADFQLAFTTGDSVDTSAPRIVSFTPEAYTTDVSLTTNISVEFDEPIDAERFLTEIRANDIRVYSSSDTISGNWTVVRNIATFDPLNPLPADTAIYVRVNDVDDQVGNESGVTTRYITTTSF